MREKVTKIGEIGAWVRRQRKARGLTQTDLAELSGTGRRFIVELEAGKKESLEIGGVLRIIRRLGFVLSISGKAGE